MTISAKTAPKKDGIRPICKECTRQQQAQRRTDPEYRARKQERDRNHYYQNRDAKIAQVNAYQAARRDTRRSYYQRWRDLNRLAKKLYDKAYGVLWRRRNPDKSRARWHRRQAKKRAVQGTFTAAEWRAMCDWFGNVCLACGEAKPLTVDHVVPLERNGPNTIENLQPLCQSCNSTKHTKTIDYRNPAQLEAFLWHLKTGGNSS